MVHIPCFITLLTVFHDGIPIVTNSYQLVQDFTTNHIILTEPGSITRYSNQSPIIYGGFKPVFGGSSQSFVGKLISVLTNGHAHTHKYSIYNGTLTHLYNSIMEDMNHCKPINNVLLYYCTL